MTITLTLPPALEQHVTAAAETRRIPVETYLLSLVEASIPQIQPAPLAGESDEDFVAAMTKLRRPGEKPLHPNETWSRAAIYRDHD